MQLSLVSNAEPEGSAGGQTTLSSDQSAKGYNRLMSSRVRVCVCVGVGVSVCPDSSLCVVQLEIAQKHPDIYAVPMKPPKPNANRPQPIG